MKRFLAIAATAMLALIACSRDEARLSVHVQSLGASTDTPELRVKWAGWPGPRTVVLDSTHRGTGAILTGTSGTFSIEFTLLSGGAETTTAGTVELPLRGDWQWGLDFFLSEDDPTETCFGCSGKLAFDVDPAMGYPPEVKLWAVWGGNSISNPVVY